MKIYTKKGDGGQTDLFNPDTGKKERVEKSDPRLEAIGTLDEVSSILGIIKSISQKDQVRIIESIQVDLFVINSLLAGSRVVFSSTKAKHLEKEIDRIEKSLAPLHNFILPGGVPSSAYCHLARAVARRAERRLVILPEFKSKPVVLKYINRLADFLFVLARYCNYLAKTKDQLWVKK